MENNKKIIITVLSVLVVAMAVGYALLAQELTINGTASIDSTWRVEITDISSKEVAGDAVNKTNPTYTATTANFSVGLTQPGDSITYDITVTNKGTLDAVVESINVDVGSNPAIIYTTSGLSRGDTIAKNNGTNTLTIKVDYDSNVTSQPVSTTNNITVTINYQQDLGQVPTVFNGTGSVYRQGDTIEMLSIGDSVENKDYTIEQPHNATAYLKHDVENYVIQSSYVCFDSYEEPSVEYCFKGGDGGASYDSNTNILRQATVNFLDASSCSFDSNNPLVGGKTSVCNDTPGFFMVSEGGNVSATYGYVCAIATDGRSECRKGTGEMDFTLFE